jgi:hypothetical protein
MTRTLRRTLGGTPFGSRAAGGRGRIARGAGQGPGTFARADELIERAIEESKLPGAVLLVGQGDKILYRKA